MNKKIAQELNEIVEKGLSKADLPYKKGNSIRVGSYVIRQKRNQYLVFNCKENCLVTKTYCLAGALAIVRKLNKGQNYIENILFYDKQLNKYSNDLMFYKHTISNTTSENRKEIAEIRYEDTYQLAEQVKHSLDKFIFE